MFFEQNYSNTIGYIFFAWIVTGSQYGERNKAIFLCWFEGPKMIKLETLFSRGFSLVHLWESQTRKNFMLASADFLRCGWVEFQHYCQCCGKKQVRIFCGRAAAQGGSSLMWQADIQLEMLTRRQRHTPQKAWNVVWCDYEWRKSNDCTHLETLVGTFHKIHRFTNEWVKKQFKV